jgi:hypothetical protein
MLQDISMQNVENFEYRECHRFEFQIWVSENHWNYEMKPGLLVSLSSRLARCTGHPRACPCDTANGDRASLVTTGRVCRPPPHDTPILLSLRPKSFCFPLLAAEDHVKPPASLLSAQSRTTIDEQLGQARTGAFDSSPASTPRHGGRPQGVGWATPRAPEKPPPPQEATHRRTTPPVIVRPKCASPSYEATPSSSPTQPSGSSTSGPSYCRRRLSSCHHHRGERRPVSLFLAPTPKSGSSPRRPPPRPISRLPAPPARREFGRHCHPTPWGVHPCFAQGLAAQPQLGRPEAAQVHSRSS